MVHYDWGTKSTMVHWGSTEVELKKLGVPLFWRQFRFEPAKRWNGTGLNFFTAFLCFGIIPEAENHSNGLEIA